MYDSQVDSVVIENVDNFKERVTISNENGTKTFIEQRIERLYGPGAFGITLKSRKAHLERFKESENISKSDITLSKNFQELPNVFRHLRPEFRYQLPVKPKAINPNDEVLNVKSRNGHCYNEKQNDTDDMEKNNQTVYEENTKSWRTLSMELENISKSELPTVFSSKENTSQSTSKENFEDNCRSSTDTKVFNEPFLANSKNGNHYLKVVETEVAFLESQIIKIEGDIDVSGEIMPEEIKGKLLSVVGKTKLLINQKLEQFKGLCLKNLKGPKEKFCITNEDLAGFWDMVVIQVDEIKDLLKEIDVLRDNKWKEVPVAVCLVKPSPVDSKKPRKLMQGEKSQPKTASRNKAAEDKRKKLRESLMAKRMEAKKNPASSSGEIEIFISDK